MRTRTLGPFLLLTLLSVLGAWLDRRAPSWLTADPLASPFGTREEEASAADESPVGTDDPGAADGGVEPRVVALDSATVASLVALPGIGPVLARRILDHRDRPVPLQRLEDLLAVKGVGPRTIERLRPWLLVGRAAVEESTGTAPDPQIDPSPRSPGSSDPGAVDSRR